MPTDRLNESLPIMTGKPHGDQIIFNSVPIQSSTSIAQFHTLSKHLTMMHQTITVQELGPNPGNQVEHSDGSLRWISEVNKMGFNPGCKISNQQQNLH